MKSFLAAFVFFTRLPLWKLKMFQLSGEYFKNVINYWAVIGWLTSGVMLLTLWLSSQIFPISIAIVLALLSRLLLTGALHEDGLADFFDGFGGGVNKQRILEIMKDSHIGTYGVLALVVYFLLSFQVLNEINGVKLLMIIFLSADCFAKLVASTITQFLAYARTEQTSKTGVVYQKTQLYPFVASLLCGLLPLLLLPRWEYLLAFILPILLYFALLNYLRKKINGYTGDTCGAIFLLCEFSIWLGFLAVQNL